MFEILVVPLSSVVDKCHMKFTTKTTKVTKFSLAFQVYAKYWGKTPLPDHVILNDASS